MLLNCRILQELVQDFCPLKIKITQYPGGFLISFQHVHCIFIMTEL